LRPNLPHPIPYQGSKRSLAPLIAPFIPSKVEIWFEPFAGSAAMTLWAAKQGVAKKYVIGDRLEPIAELWRAIIERPQETGIRYTAIWKEQRPDNADYFNTVRERYNQNRDPVDLLYLICRCVKNAVRFNKYEKFTQSVDKRRLGMRPEKMIEAIAGASYLLRGRTEVVSGDWLKTTAPAGRRDFLYMDPPYLGTSIGRDKRYAHQMAQNELISGLAQLRGRNVRFALSYDGMTGTKEYGPALPTSLGLTRLLLHAGTSSQSTLSGRKEETVESLYLSPGLAIPRKGVIRHAEEGLQSSLAF
jgi:DNA adenine methylase